MVLLLELLERGELGLELLDLGVPARDDLLGFVELVFGAGDSKDQDCSGVGHLMLGVESAHHSLLDVGLLLRDHLLKLLVVGHGGWLWVRWWIS